MNVQKKVIDAIFDQLFVRAIDALSVRVSRFSSDYFEVTGLMTSQAEADVKIDEFMQKDINARQFMTNFVPLFEWGKENLPDDGIMVIITDGQPFIPGVKRKIAIQKSKKAAIDFRKAKPDVKVFCIYSGNAKKTRKTDFLYVACTAGIWQMPNRMTSLGEQKGIAFGTDVGERICTRHIELPGDPCKTRSSKVCRGVWIDRHTGDFKNFRKTPSYAPGCNWHKKRKCSVKAQYKRFYYH